MGKKKKADLELSEVRKGDQNPKTKDFSPKIHWNSSLHQDGSLGFNALNSINVTSLNSGRSSVSVL